MTTKKIGRIITTKQIIRNKRLHGKLDHLPRKPYISRDMTCKQDRIMELSLGLIQSTEVKAMMSYLCLGKNSNRPFGKC
jgi:hypothetical protein